MTEYTVHFQKGTKVGARSLHMVHVEADSVTEAKKKAKVEHATWGDDHHNYKMVRVDHFDGYHIVVDC